MMPGVSHRTDDRHVEGVAELHEARGLVGAVGVDGAAEVRRVVGDDADRPPLDADQRGHHAAAEVAAQLQHRALVGQRLDDLAHVVDAQPVLRDDCAQRRWSAQSSRQRGPGSRRGTAWRRRRPRPRRRRRCRPRRWAPAPTSGRSPRGGTRRGRRPRSSPGRPCRCSSSAVAMITSQQPSSAALPAKQRPESMPTSGTRPLTAGRRWWKVGVEADEAAVVVVARPAAAALGEEHQRQRPRSATRTSGRSCSGCACPGCRPAPCSRRPSRARGGRVAEQLRR